MTRREYPISPSQDAINGALAIFVGGRNKNNAATMLFGLSVLRSAKEEQLLAAIQTVQKRGSMRDGEIQEMLAR